MEFPTTADGIRFRWNAELDAYEIMHGDGNWDELVKGQYSEFLAGADKVYFEQINGQYAYSAMATVYTEQNSGNYGTAFAYGIPTAAGDVPVSGSANYDADLRGASDGGYGIYGTASLNFNFGSGTLSGAMDPHATDPFGDDFYLGTYTFTDTVYSVGNTDYSGRFSWNGATVGDFAGHFTGPGAAELIGAFNAPFVDPYFPSTIDTMHGAWAGRRN